MPKTKKIISKQQDESPNKKKTVAKKSEKFEASPTGKQPKKNTSVNEEDLWALGKSRYVRVNKFLGEVYVDIRCYYYKDDGIHPGKAGIGLTIEQWDKLKLYMKEINKTIDSKSAKK